MHNVTKQSRLLAGLFLVLVAALLPVAAVAESPVLSEVIANDILRVGMSADQPPFTFRSRTGSVVGFDVELARAMAVAMNLELKIVEIPFGELLIALEQERVDMVMSGVAITPQRASKVAFIGPYTLSAKSLTHYGKSQSRPRFRRQNLIIQRSGWWRWKTPPALFL